MTANRSRMCSKCTYGDKKLKTPLVLLLTCSLVVSGLYICSDQYQVMASAGVFSIQFTSRQNRTGSRALAWASGTSNTSGSPVLDGLRRGIQLPVKSSAFQGPSELNLYDTKTVFTSALWTDGCGDEDKTIHHSKCTSPRQNIVLVKTHKCGSSTISATLLRYASKHNLRIALPKPDPSHIGWPKPYRPAYVQNYEELKPFNVLANHIVYDRCYVQHDFPRSETVYATILREPWSQFVSTVNYFHFPQFPPARQPLKTILDQPDIWARALPMGEPPAPNAERSLIKNMMANDLGFHNDQAENQTAIELFIKRLDGDFDLVMILEYLHESLVLLKRLLCWELSDFFYLKLNPKRSHRADEEMVTPLMITAHRKMDDVDYQVYNHFYHKLQVVVNQQDESFTREVATFTDAIDKISDYCSAPTGNGGKRLPLKLSGNEFLRGQWVSMKDCILWKMLPRPFTKELKTKLKTDMEHIDKYRDGIEMEV